MGYNNKGLESLLLPPKHFQTNEITAPQPKPLYGVSSGLETIALVSVSLMGAMALAGTLKFLYKKTFGYMREKKHGYQDTTPDSQGTL